MDLSRHIGGQVAYVGTSWQGLTYFSWAILIACSMCFISLCQGMVWQGGRIGPLIILFLFYLQDPKLIYLWFLDMALVSRLGWYICEWKRETRVGLRIQLSHHQKKGKKKTLIISFLHLLFISECCYLSCCLKGRGRKRRSNEMLFQWGCARR